MFIMKNLFIHFSISYSIIAVQTMN